MERVEKSNEHLRTEIYPRFKKSVMNLQTVINSELKSETVNLKLAWVPGDQGGSCWSCDSLCPGLKHRHFRCCLQVRTVRVQLVYLRRGKTMPPYPRNLCLSLIRHSRHVVKVKSVESPRPKFTFSHLLYFSECW